MTLPDYTHIIGDTQFRYTPDVGEVPQGQEIYCGVCGDKMQEERNVLGVRSWAESMARHLGTFGSYRFDKWTCVHSTESWHKQVVSLRNEKHQTQSASIRKMLEEEIKLVLRDRISTI